jgi:hypothetical protein
MLFPMGQRWYQRDGDDAKMLSEWLEIGEKSR